MGPTIETQQHIALPAPASGVQRGASEGGFVLVWDSSQAWFWTPSWQAGEREASRELTEGRGRSFATAEEFLASLEDQ